MSPKEIKALIKTLRAAGVNHFKSGDIELTFVNQEPLATVSHETKSKAIPLDAPSEPDPEIKHKVEELTSLLKLSDTDLVDRLFPDHTDYGDDEEATA